METNLRQLARILTDDGWTCTLRVADGRPLLRVVDARVPVLGETIAVALVPDAGGGPAAWFRSSTGVLLGPCDDPGRAATGVRVLLGPWVARALGAGRRSGTGLRNE
ncbi:hypothetical protein [Actinomadura bangladeshensis]|uniref:Uncharacterized protein n=1 Tax=Actinomadura bangladeshensis TaxID=453573 RepID=A0A6L9QNA0_9ACTN|nr:hypothetical protein [Actinomadura bangladeshensis]NEA26183.1 hypothetical protein [Actinomadura bangladeshensis]